MSGGELALVISAVLGGLATVAAAVTALLGRAEGKESLAQSMSKLALEALAADYRRVRAERDECREALEGCEDGQHE